MAGLNFDVDFLFVEDVADNPVEQHEADGIQRRSCVLIAERREEVIHSPVNGESAALGIVADGNGTEQDGQYLTIGNPK